MSSPKDLMNKINNDGNRDTNIRRKETGNRPVLRPENGESIDQCQDRKENHCKPGSPGLHDGVAIGDLRIGDALCFDCFAEAEISDAAADP